MYDWASEVFKDDGYSQYEISNWAKDTAPGGATPGRDASSRPTYACRHNLQYWRGLPYLAIGAGAHGYANGYRYSNVLRIKTYIERLTEYESTNHSFPLTPTTVNHHKQTQQDDMSEFMMTRLRLIQEGVSEQDFRMRFGQSMCDVYGKEIDELLDVGLVEWYSAGENGSSDRGLRITQPGRLLGNQVFMRFV
jgi:oxygen-independent coproporphyrinogen-3 oxidase